MGDIRWKPRAFVEDDFEKASALRKFFLDPNTASVRRSCEPEYYRWKILENPFQQGIFHVAEDNGKVVGMTTVTPKRLCVFGRSLLGGELGDGFTHPDYQRQGIFSALLYETRKKAVEQGIDFIYGTPNENALPSEQKAGYDLIPSARIHSLVRPLNMRPILESRLRSPLLAGIFAPLATVFYALRYRIGPNKINRQDVRLEEVPAFPESIDRLWGIVCSNYDWILERSKPYLDWRFVANPDSYRVLVAQDSHDMLGYLVAKMGRWRNLHVGYLADFLTVEDNSRIFEGLIYQVVTGFIEANADMVACWCVADGFYDRILRAKGFRVYESVPIICYHKTEIGTEVLTRDAKWHFTMADSDNI